jgi:BTB/POZ domain
VFSSSCSQQDPFILAEEATMETISWEFPDLASNMNSKHKTTAKQALGTSWVMELDPSLSPSLSSSPSPSLSSPSPSLPAAQNNEDHDGDSTTNNKPTNQSDADEQRKQEKKKKLFTVFLTRKKLANSEPVILRVRYAFSTATTTTNSNQHSSSSSLIWSNKRSGNEFEVDLLHYVEGLVLFDDDDDDAAAKNTSINNDKDPALIDHTDHAGRGGTLIITVHFKLLGAGGSFSTITTEPVWKPNKILPHATLTKMRTDSTWTDIAFAVGGRNFKAHRSILALHAPALLRLAENNKVEEEDDSSDTTKSMIELPDLDPLVFANLLAYCYDGSRPHQCRTIDAFKSLLIAADRFECTSLKLYMEHRIAEKVLSATNAADLLLLADSMSCAYLKEAALDEIAFLPEAVFRSDGWTRVMQSERLMMEVIRARYCEPNVEDKKRRRSRCGREPRNVGETIQSGIQLVR